MIRTVVVWTLLALALLAQRHMYRKHQLVLKHHRELLDELQRILPIIPTPLSSRVERRLEAILERHVAELTSLKFWR